MNKYEGIEKSKFIDSDDVSTDEGAKRKFRDDYDQDEDDTFKKSRRTMRTPRKECQQKSTTEAKLDVLMEMIKDVTTELKKIRMEQKEYREDIKNLQRENSMLKKKTEVLEKENKEIRAEIKEIKRSTEIREKERKQNNIIISGLKMDTSDSIILKQAMANFTKEHLQVEAKIKLVRKLGPKTCLVELESAEEKRKIMQNKAKLRNLKGEKIFINDDLTKKEMEMQKNLRTMAQEERNSGKVVKVGYQKLIINGTEWRWNKEREKLEIKESKN